MCLFVVFNPRSYFEIKALNTAAWEFETWKRARFSGQSPMFIAWNPSPHAYNAFCIPLIGQPLVMQHFINGNSPRLVDVHFRRDFSATLDCQTGNCAKNWCYTRVGSLRFPCLSTIERGWWFTTTNVCLGMVWSYHQKFLITSWYPTKHIYIYICILYL